MYTSYIGRKFLKLYKEKYNKADSYSAREFFDEVLFPLFFNDVKHLMHVHGSSFFQKLSKTLQETGKDEHILKLERLHTSIKNKKISGSTYVGYAAEDVRETTSGQVSSIDRLIESEEMYSSWIGEALGIGVSGGFIILIDEHDILFALFEGWNHYRKFLEQTPNVKDKQIETWNGHWLSLYFNKDFSIDSVDYSGIETTEVVGKLAIPTQKWSQLIFTLARRFSNRILTVFCYNLSQMNTTLGFLNIFLPEVRRFYELRDQIFLDKEKTILSDKEIESLETFFNFKNACKFGTIGLKALEPAKLREFMPKGTVDYAQGKDFKFTDENSRFNYKLYKLWIIAMLNKTELLQLAADVAKALLDHEILDSKGNRGKTEKNQDSKKVKNSKNIRDLIENLTALLEKTPQNANSFKEVVERTLKMPSDNFPLFATLIRFEYTYQKTKI